MSYQSLLCRFFFSFIHQTASKSTEIARPRGNHQSVMVITRHSHVPAHKPPSLFFLMLGCRKGGRGVFAGFYRIIITNFTAEIGAITPHKNCDISTDVWPAWAAVYNQCWPQRRQPSITALWTSWTEAVCACGTESG